MAAVDIEELVRRAIGASIRQARESHRTRQGRVWSQAKLAHMLNQASGFRFTTTANYVSKWERGDRKPGYEWGPLVERVLGLDLAAIEAEARATLGNAADETVRRPPARYRAAPRVILEVDQSVCGKPQDVDRRTSLKTALGTAAGVALARYAPAGDGDSSDLLLAVAGPTAHYRRMEQDVSSQRLAPAVDAHFALATGIVAGQLRTASGYSVLAEISGLAAWLAADRGDAATARRRYTEAVHHAGRAHHPLLSSYMTASLGHFAVESGDPRQGAMLLDRAAAQLDNSAPSAARAWLASLHAIAHAALGDRKATYSALRAADKAISQKQGEPAWPWVFSFDRAKANRYQAGALTRLGDLRAAMAAFEAIPPTLGGPKPRAIAQLEQAQVLARAGDVERGCALALEALRVGRDYGSERITARVRAFRASLPARTSAATMLDDALTALYEDQT